uniref:Uncharacterized protein n=1 Tax=Marinobacter nauticus TaxID=2743 RepID=A0A455VZV8_MARNT|nr:hypothetical protein YBY_02370 [Marinobacter nauticus]
MQVLQFVTRSLLVLTLMVIAGPPAYAESQLQLYAKDPDSWQRNAHGGAGVLRYDTGTNRFHFTASGLIPKAHYALIRHSNKVRDVQIVTTGSADQKGSLSLAGLWSHWKGSFWLVLESDFKLTDGKPNIRAWRPDLYLFEHRTL